MFTASSIPSDHRDLIHDVAFNIAGDRMATCSSDQCIKVWDMIEGREWKNTCTWKAHSGSVWKIAWADSEFGQVIASCSFDRTTAVWEEICRGIESNNPNGLVQKQWVKRTNLVDSRTSVMDIKFAPKTLGLLLAACSADGIVRLYEAPDVMNLAQWTLQQEISCKHQACCIAWNPSYSKEKRYGKNSFIKIKNNTEKKEQDLRGDDVFEGGCSQKFPFSVEKTDRFIVIPQVPMLAIGCDDANCGPSNRVVILQYLYYVRRWNKIDSAPSIPDPVQDIAFSPRLGRSFDMFAVASSDIRIFTIGASNSLRFEITLMGVLDDHRAPVWRISWNPLGNKFSSSGDDGYVRVWKQGGENLSWVCYMAFKGDNHMPVSNNPSHLNTSSTHGSITKIIRLPIMSQSSSSIKH